MEPQLQLHNSGANAGVVEFSSHSRLPRLDLGIDWEPGWQQFGTSLRDFVSGPRPDKDAVLPPGSVLRGRWIRGRFPISAFGAASVWHIGLIVLLCLPIWGFLPAPARTLAPVQLELTWYVPPDLPNISLPAPVKKVQAPRKPEIKKEETPDAEEKNPRQTIRSIAVVLTHPRQTLIRPDAPPEPPKIETPLPNIVEWAAPKPRVVLPASESVPQAQNRKIQDVAAPDIANNEKNLGPMSIISAPPLEKPKLPVLPMSAHANARANRTDASAAPNIAGGDGDQNELNRLIALSANPAPPAPRVPIPDGNLAANISASPNGGKAGGATVAATPGAGGAALSAGGSLPAAVSVSGGTKKPPGPRGLYSEKLNLKPPPDAPGAPRAASASASVANFDPSLPPEKILSGKEVYTMHVNSPNFTSSTGSWIVNFAQLDENANPPFKPKGELSGPAALHKVDPKYPPALIEQHVKGEVILYAIIRKDGSIDSIQIVKSLDPLLDRNAINAFAQWTFKPGTRAGAPVDIEAVVHVPFTYQSQ